MIRLGGLNGVLGGAIGGIALVALAGGAISLASLGQLRVAYQSRDRSNAILHQIDAFRGAMLDQETGVRGYMLTRRQGSLAPYVFGRDDLEQAIGRLGQLVRRAGPQGRDLALAVAAARSWQGAIATPVIADLARPAGGRLAAMLESGGAGKARFDSFREALSRIERRERASLADQSAVVERAEHRVIAVVVAATLVTLLISLAVGLAINRMVAEPLTALADTMARLIRREADVEVPNVARRNEVGTMARAVALLKRSLVELDRTALLRVTTDTLPAMIGYIDASRRIGFLNSEFERWFGDLDREAAQGRPLAEVFEAKPLPGAGGPLARALAGEEARFEDILPDVGGVPRELEGYFRPHHAPDDRVLGAVVLFTDLTARKDLDRRLARQAGELARSNEELEQFAYVASHDLKAPLRGIENLANWIEEDLGEALAGEARANMDLLKSRVRRLDSLLDDLLAYSRAGRATRSAEPVDTRALVAQVADLIGPPAGLAIEADASLPVLLAAAAPLTQTFHNLIGNAVKHHPEPAAGHVRVSAEPRGDMTEFVVADDGVGIPERYHERVFGMFQTLRPRDEVEGSGMGLAIVRKLVEARGGAIWLTTGLAGAGLGVHFTWPGRREERV